MAKAKKMAKQAVADADKNSKGDRRSRREQAQWQSKQLWTRAGEMAKQAVTDASKMAKQAVCGCRQNGKATRCRVTQRPVDMRNSGDWCQCIAFTCMVFDISMDLADERKDDGGKGERQEKSGRKEGGKVNQEKKSYWKEAYLEEEDFPESELWNEDEMRIGGNIYIQVEDTWKLYKACMERINALEQGDERQRKIEELEEEAGTNKQIYETLWGLARQRRRRYLKTRYDQASWCLSHWRLTLTRKRKWGNVVGISDSERAICRRTVEGGGYL
eukprot:g10174.t1